MHPLEYHVVLWQTVWGGYALLCTHVTQDSSAQSNKLALLSARLEARTATRFEKKKIQGMT